MAGIYIHIPFCRQTCHYCNFHFSTNQKLRSDMVDAICREWQLRKSYWEDAQFDTLYLGGGTPSILSTPQLTQIIEQFQPLDLFAEVTLEANPDDITAEKLKAWKSMGIHRLSVGVQSFLQKNLDWMNRAHNAEESEKCLELIFDAGYQEVSIDLIYGMAGQNMEDWQKDLKRAFQYPITHLSTYQLTVEDNTALKHDIEKGEYSMPDDELVVEEFDFLMDWIEKQGWEHYEISNSAKKGFRAIHNSQYWDGTPYIGLGPGAHSYDRTHRSWNVSNNPKYIKSIQNKDRPADSEFITDEIRFNEWLMTGLRRTEGLKFAELSDFPAYLQSYFESAVQGYCNSKYVQMNSKSMHLSREGKHYADRIASELMYV